MCVKLIDEGYVQRRISSVRDRGQKYSSFKVFPLRKEIYLYEKVAKKNNMAYCVEFSPGVLPESEKFEEVDDPLFFFIQHQRLSPKEIEKTFSSILDYYMILLENRKEEVEIAMGDVEEIRKEMNEELKINE